MFSIFLHLCFSLKSSHPINTGFNSIELSPGESISIESIDPQSFFLFTNPDPRIFKLQLYKDNEFVSEPFQNNGPILDFIKFGRKEEKNKNSFYQDNNIDKQLSKGAILSSLSNEKVTSNNFNKFNEKENVNAPEKDEKSNIKFYNRNNNINTISQNANINNDNPKNNNNFYNNNFNINNRKDFANNQLNNGNYQINNKNTINNGNSQINNKNNYMNNANSQLNNGNNQINNRNNQLNNGNNQLNNGNNQLNNGNNQFNNGNNQFNNGNNQINNKNNQINNGNNQINNGNNQINNKNNQINNGNNQINNANSQAGNQMSNGNNKMNYDNNPKDENNQIGDRSNQSNQNYVNKPKDENNEKDPSKMTEKDLIFGMIIGIRSHKIIITGAGSQSPGKKVAVNFYYLSQQSHANQIYFSTYPNDVFTIGRPPDGFNVCKNFNERLIAYWNVPGERIFYETNAIDQSQSGEVHLMSDNKQLNTFKSTDSISTTKATGDFLYFDWMSQNVRENSSYKVLIRNEKTISQYVEKYCSKGIDRYSSALNHNLNMILPPTRYQFTRQVDVSYIHAKHRYGHFARKKDCIPLTTNLSPEKQKNWPIAKTILIIFIIIFFIVLLVFSALDKLQSVSYSTGFGEGYKRRRHRRRSRRNHRRINEAQNNMFGLEYYIENNDNDNDNNDFEDYDLDDGNLTVTKKKKRSPEMQGIMQEILNK